MISGKIFDNDKNVLFANNLIQNTDLTDYAKISALEAGEYTIPNPGYLNYKTAVYNWEWARTTYTLPEYESGTLAYVLYSCSVDDNQEVQYTFNFPSSNKYILILGCHIETTVKPSIETNPYGATSNDDSNTLCLAYFVRYKDANPTIVKVKTSLLDKVGFVYLTL